MRKLCTRLVATIILATFGLCAGLSARQAISPDSVALLASTYFGGPGMDGLLEVPMVLDDEGNVYIASRTKSTVFPVYRTPGPPTGLDQSPPESMPGGSDVF